VIICKFNKELINFMV